MLAYDPAANPLNTNEWAFPLCECVHIAAFAFSMGMITLVDLRMLGFGLTRRTASQLVHDTDVWTLLGLAVVITSGLAIFSSDPVHYLHNRPFQLKMIGLLAAIVYNYTLHRKAAESGRPSLFSGAAAAFSLALWASLAFAGVFIGFY